MLFEPHSIELSAWHALLAGSAHRVLKRKANARPRKAQSVHDVATSEALGLLAPCEAELTRLQAATAALCTTIDTRYLCTDEARLCFRDAWAAVQVGKSRPEDDARTTRPCCISHSSDRVRLMCLVGPDWRASHHAVARAWRAWVESAMVVGGVCLWLDERVALWLAAHPELLNEREQMTRETLVQLLPDPALELLRQAFNHACRVLVHTLQSL